VKSASNDPRNRITEGVNRARLVSEARRSVRSGVLFAVGAIVMLAIAAYLVTNLVPTFGHDTYQVRFAVPQDFGVFEGVSDVRFRGVKAGTISSAERRGTQLILVATIRKDAGIVYRNARAQIRPITPLNDVYLDIVDPGTPSGGRADPNQPLNESQTETSVTVPDVLNTFNPDARLGAQRLLDQLGNGVADGGLKLRRALVALAPFLKQAGALTQDIAYRSAITKRLIHNTAVLTTELGRRQIELRRLVATGAATVGTLAAGSRDLDATLAQIGPTFTELRSSLASVRGVIGTVDAGVSSLYPVADRLQGGLASLRSLNATLSPAVAALQRPVSALVPWVVQLNQVSDRLQPIATALRPQVPTVDRLAQRLVDCQKGVIGFFQWNTSLSKFGDQNGPEPRGNLAFGIPAVGLPGEPLRLPEKGCTPGLPVRAVPAPGDLH
jgi:virulence factor Mce-like protein